MKAKEAKPKTFNDYLAKDEEESAPPPLKIIPREPNEEGEEAQESTAPPTPREPAQEERQDAATQALRNLAQQTKKKDGENTVCEVVLPLSSPVDALPPSAVLVSDEFEDVLVAVNHTKDSLYAQSENMCAKIREKKDLESGLKIATKIVKGRIAELEAEADALLDAARQKKYDKKVRTQLHYDLSGRQIYFVNPETEQILHKREMTVEEIQARRQLTLAIPPVENGDKEKEGGENA